MPVQKRIQGAAAAVAGLLLAGGAIAYGLQGGSKMPGLADAAQLGRPTTAPSGAPSGGAPSTVAPSTGPTKTSVPSTGPSTAQATGSAAPSTTPPAPVSGGGDPVFPVPVAPSECLKQLRRLCYGPAQYRAAYDLNPLYARGITGKGKTIVLVESFGSPTLQHDVDVYDKQFGLPPIQLQIEKWGAVPAFDAANGDMRGWALETTMDVQAAHAVAPDAAIVVIETAVAETEGTVGVPEMMDALKRDVDAGRGDVVSMSWGTTEGRFDGFGGGDYTSLTSLRYAFEDAAKHDVTLLASSGDGGGTSGLNAAWPAGDPLVTGVGGTMIRLNDDGSRVVPDAAWSGSGGSTSKVFPRPVYQKSVTNVGGDHRLVPDVSLSAATAGAAWVYCTALPSRSGWTADGAGTSLSSPLFAGIIALADQAVGHRLGQINTQIYQLAAAHSPAVVDVASGNNGKDGFVAGAGYDQATGVGTVDATEFVKALGG